MRWQGQDVEAVDHAALPGLARISNLIRSVQTPDFAGVTFHEVAARSALNRVPSGGYVPFGWTINPYRGCTHACVYCFARASHRYLDLDTGTGFDSQIVVKVNVVDVVRAELARPAWNRDLVALGTNTDPYQRAEGRYRLMPGIIKALADAATPLSILTKGTLLRRDLPLLASVAADVPVRLSISIAVFDDALQASVEPGTPSAAARLATVSAAADLGFAVDVFLMPVLPGLTDGEDHVDAALMAIKAAGAASVGYTTLHLRPGVRVWYAQWLRREHPSLLPLYRELYGDGSRAHREYRIALAERMKRLIARHGLDGWNEEESESRREVAAPPATAPQGALF